MSEHEDILAETRELLNALNVENAELKARNRALSAKVRDAEEAVREARRSEKDLERDSKQLNFSLMQQVQAKVEEARAAQSREAAATERARVAEAALSAARDAAAASEARLESCKQQLRESEMRADALHSRVTALEEDGRATTEELQRALQTERDQATLNTRKHHAASLQLREELAELRRKCQELEAHSDALAIEKATAKSACEAECERLRRAAQRTLDAEAEVAYCHDQMLSTSEHVAQELDTIRSVVIAALHEVRGNDAALVDLQNCISDQKDAVARLREFDQTIDSVTRRGLEELRDHESVARHDVDSAHAEAALAKESAAQLQQRMQDAERTVARLEEDLASTRAHNKDLETQCAEVRGRLQQSQNDVSRLEAESSRLRLERDHEHEAAARASEAATQLERRCDEERAEFTAKIQEKERQFRSALESERSRALRAEEHAAALEEENTTLQVELRSHTESLAAELHRLQVARSVSGARRSSARDPMAGVIANSDLHLHHDASDHQRSPSSHRRAAPSAPPRSEAARSPSPAVTANLAQRILASVRPASETRSGTSWGA